MAGSRQHISIGYETSVASSTAGPVPSAAFSSMSSRLVSKYSTCGANGDTNSATPAPHTIDGDPLTIPPPVKENSVKKVPVPRPASIFDVCNEEPSGSKRTRSEGVTDFNALSLQRETDHFNYSDLSSFANRKKIKIRVNDEAGKENQLVASETTQTAGPSDRVKLIANYVKEVSFVKQNTLRNYQNNYCT